MNDQFKINDGNFQKYKILLPLFLAQVLLIHVSIKIKTQSLKINSEN